MSLSEILYLQEAEVSKLRQVIREAKVKGGPCERSIESALDDKGIHRQAYHGGAFIGNHVNKALKEPVVSAITSAPVVVVEQRCPSLATNAKEIADRYKKLMSQYAACRQIFSTTDAVDNTTLDQLQVRIDSFMTTARQEVVDRQLGNITPKLHLLEEHVVPCMRRFGVGLGLLAEQGGEGIHHELNAIAATLSSMRNELSRLQTIVQNTIASLLFQCTHSICRRWQPGLAEDGSN